MQETNNNCFGSKICSTTLCQGKTGKHECRNITVTYYFGTRAYLISPEEGSCYVFSIQNNCCEFFASYSVIIQSVAQSFLKKPVCGTSLTYYSKYIIQILARVFTFASLSGNFPFLLTFEV